MCGIFGIAYADRDRPVELSNLQQMSVVLKHRGPDDSGFHLDENVGLGHRRLSIVDVEGGHQPMANEDGMVWVICNGEIYNHSELRGQLVRGGHRYLTRSDSETILHLYEEHGVNALSELQGMFAFALWDARTRRLILARDRLGIKPVYYWHSRAGDLVWASEIKALFASEQVRPALNTPALPEYLTNRYTTGDRTLFQEIRRVLPGHFLTWEQGNLGQRAYWRLSDVIGTDAIMAGSGDPKGVAAAFREQFRESVRSHLMSDVPLGVFLSGGLDSSAVAVTMSELVGERLRTFSVGYDCAPESELGYARQVAEHLGAEHREVRVSADDFFSVLPRLVWHEDEPIAFPSSVSLYFVAALASESVKVVLTGEGSDELLAGYGKYWRTLWNIRLGRGYERLPWLLRRWVQRQVRRLPPTLQAARRLTRTFLTRSVDPVSLYFDNFGVFGAEDLPLLLCENVLEAAIAHEADPYAGHRRLWAEGASAPLLTRLLYVDSLSYLHELLMKQDQMSMAASIESRVPFLDHRLVELAFRLPEHMKLRGTRTKIVLRDLMRDRLPKEVLRRRKMGFPTPLGRWLAGTAWGHVEDLLIEPTRVTAGLVRDDYVQRMVLEHRSGKADHTERLWTLINLELWARQYPGLIGATT